MWVAIHSARYGSAQTSLLAVALFGFIGASLTFLSGSIIPWYILHVFNNFFIKAVEIFSSQKVIAALVIVLIIYTTLVILLKTRKFFRGKK